MAETAAKTTTPRRGRASTAKTTPAKAAAPAKALTPAKEATDDGMARFPFVCEANGATKSYAKFTPPANSGCVGTLYVPLGTEEVKVLLIGPADVVDAEVE
jgi:hypothetical protein